MYPFGETLIVQERADSDDDSHGNPTVAYTPRPPVKGVAFDPGGTVETFEPGRNPTVTSPRVLSREPIIASPGDRALVGGLLFEVQGDVAKYTNPWTGLTGWVLNLKRVEG